MEKREKKLSFNNSTTKDFNIFFSFRVLIDFGEKGRKRKKERRKEREKEREEKARERKKEEKERTI